MRATKLVNNVKHLSYENPFKKIKLPTLKYRRFKGDTIEVYKIIHGKYDKTCSLKLELECRLMPNVMADPSNLGGALCSMPQSLAHTEYWSAMQ